jgi:hypothetical protein
LYMYNSETEVRNQEEGGNMKTFQNSFSEDDPTKLREETGLNITVGLRRPRCTIFSTVESK